MNYLKIGDYIILKQSKLYEGCLTAEGIISEDILFYQEEQEYENCLWQIHVQNQYSAVREYEEVLFSSDTGIGKNSSDGTSDAKDGSGPSAGSGGGGGGNMVTNDELLSQLHRAAVNEGRLNEKLMAMKIGKPVAFGDVIQLRHVKSKKFLTVNSTSLAKQERENLRVTLDSYGDPLSWLVFMPKSKGDREGQLISANAETLLRVHERPSEYIHCSKKEYRSGLHLQRKEREINCSLESTNSCWSLMIYHQAHEVISRNILASQMICLQEPESSHFIIPHLDRMVTNVDSCRVTLSPSALLSVDSTACTVGSHLLWIIEKTPLSKGGIIGSSRTDRILLRHLNSGLYMRIDSTSSITLGCTMSLITAVRNREEGSYFEIYPQDSREVTDGSLLQFCSKGLWIFASSPLGGGRSASISAPTPVRRTSTSSRFNLGENTQETTTPSLLGASLLQTPGARALTQSGRILSRNSSLGPTPNVRSCAAVPDRALASYILITNSLQQQLGVELYLGVEAAKLLRSFEAVARSKSILTESVTLIESRIRSIFSVLETVFEFLTDDVSVVLQTQQIGQNIKKESSNLEGVNKSSTKIMIRQTLMREQGILDAILGIIELCGTSIFEEIPRTVRRFKDNPRNRVNGVTRESSQTHTFKKLLSQLSVDVAPPSQNVVSSPSETERKSMTRVRTFSSEVALIPQQSRRSHPLMIDTGSRRNSMERMLSDDEQDPDQVHFDHLESNLKTLSQDISTACFKTLLAIIYDNHSNQMYIADKFPILLNQVKDQELAVVCVQEMLRDNLQMLQTKVREREIGIFLHLLEESEMNVTLLNLLRSTCSCPMGVDTTQRMVVSALFQPLYTPAAINTEDIFQTPPRQLSVISDDSEDSRSPVDLIRQASSISAISDIDSEDKVQVVRTRIISKAPRPSLMMMTPNTAYVKMRRSYVFTAASLRRSLLISVHTNPKIRIKNIEWSRNILYLPESSEDYRSIFAYSLVVEGLPKLSVSWEIDEGNNFSMVRLFNVTKEVPYETLCHIHSPHRQKLNGRIAEGRIVDNTQRATENAIVARASVISRRASHAVRRTGRNTLAGKTPKLKNSHGARLPSLLESKIQIADYFCTELYLLADLCLDRNYVSMNFIELKFPYETLITILKNPDSPRRFKAPVCRLLRCLYVDRDPQVEAKYPRLIRTSISLGGGNESNFTFHHEGSPHTFCLLQEIISDFIHTELDTRKCDDLSSEMICLLLALMKFGFYSNIRQLKDVINPLANALDDHRSSTPFTNISKDLSSQLSSSNANLNSLPKKEINSQSIGLQARSLWNSIWSSVADCDELSATDDDDEEIPFSFWSFFKFKRGVAPDDLPVTASTSFSFSRERSFQKVDSRSKSGHRKTVSKLPSYKNLQQHPSRLFSSEETTWEADFLVFAESPIFVVFIVLLVAATTLIAVFNLLDVHQDGVLVMSKIDLGISIVFILEIVTRLYCTYVVYNDLLTFIINPYKLLDVSVVLLDIMLLTFGGMAVGVGLQGVSDFAKTLRILRILRLVRLLRAARLLRSIATKHEIIIPYIVPARYSSTTEDEIKTIREIIQVLAVIHDRLQDQKLDTLIQHFSSWFDESIRNNSMSPRDIYVKICSASHLTTTFPENFGDALLDVLMYSDSSLVQETLKLLMMRLCHAGLFIETARKVQIIYSWRLENIYKNLLSYLKDLKVHAESFELWGSLTSEADNSVAEAIITILETISDYTIRKTEGKFFDWENSIITDQEVQQLLHNLDAFSVFMLLLKSISPQHDENNSQKKVQAILQACNNCIVLFVEYNEVNQTLAFPHIDWFLERVSDDCGSSKVARAIISGNRHLIKQCPRSYVSELFQKIINEGRRAEYLDLLIGMTDITDDGDSGIISLRSEISRYVTNRDRAQFLIEWCDKKDSFSYQRRKKAMEIHVGANRPIRDSELSPDLRYHINLLSLIAGCKLGQKIQAVYPIEDLVDAIIDSATITSVRRGLGLLLLEIVEDKLIGLDGSEAIWNFFEMCVTFFEDATETLLDYFNKDFHVFRQVHADWIHISLDIITTFFLSFDIGTFRDLIVFENESSITNTHRTEHEILKIIETLYDSLKEFHKTHLPIIGPSLSTSLGCAVATLQKCHFLSTPTHSPTQMTTDAIELDYQNQIRNQSILTGVASPIPQPLNKRGRNLRKMPSLSADAIHEAFYRKQYHVFLDQISLTKDEYYASSREIFENMLCVDDSGHSDVRLEPLISKICQHIRNRISRSGISVTLDPDAVHTALWLIETWSLIIYKDIGLDITLLADPQHSIDIPGMSKYQRIMNDNGVTILCLDLIAVGIDSSLKVAALKLLVALLATNGGNKIVQETISHSLSKTDSMLFFEAIRDMIEQMMVWCQRDAEKFLSLKKEKNVKIDASNFPENTFEPLPEELIVLKVVHSICDGGYLTNKDLIREQTGNTRLVNLLDYFGYYIDLLSRLESHNCTKIALRVVHTILGLIQGPCRGNQEHFVLHTNLLSASNRIMRSSQGLLTYSAEWENDLEVLKERVLDVLLTCIEGHLPHASVVFERVQIAMELNVLNVLIMPSEAEEYEDAEEKPSLSSLQAKYLVFLKSLVNDESEIPSNALTHMKHEVRNVEIIWHQQPHTHYFHLPPVALDISESSKRRLIEEVDLSSQDLKLKDFMKIAKDLHREAAHHQILKAYGILNAWDLKTNLSWIMLLNCFVINALLVGYFQTDADTQVRYLPSVIEVIVFSLSIAQVFLAFWNLGIYIIVRVPVVYWSFVDNGLTKFQAIIFSITDPMFLWSVFYVGLTIIAIFKSFLFFSICLLDFVVLDSTSRDVMYAVVYPARQLATAIIIILIIVNVFAGFIFTFYGTDFELERLTNLTLWDTMKLVITYGVRANEGVGAYMTPNISTRILLDMFFYLIVTVVLLNIFFGIIIDTFGKLRNLKVEREAETANKCFICGVEAHDFMKEGTSTANISFKQHREERHNMWNYLYFAMHLWQQPREKDSSVEMAVRFCMEHGDVSWFPIGCHDLHNYGSPTSDEKPEETFDSTQIPTPKPSSSLEYSNSFPPDSASSLTKHFSSTAPLGSQSGDSGDYDRLMRTELDKLGEIINNRMNRIEETLAAQISRTYSNSSPIISEMINTIVPSLQPLRRLQSISRVDSPPPSSPEQSPAPPRRS